MATEPDSARIRAALETITDELGGVKHLEINYYELNNGKRYTNLYCPESIAGVEESSQNKYTLSEVSIGKTTTASLVPLQK